MGRLNIPGLAPEHAEKLARLANPKVERIVSDFAARMKPAKISVITDTPEDAAYVRAQALAKGEERALATPGHPVHCDGVQDQGRDKEVTRVLLTPGGLRERLRG